MPRIPGFLLRAAALGLCLGSAPGLLLAQSDEDSAISEAVTDRITAAWGDEPSGVIVVVEEGVVQIRGQAPSAAAADRAVEIAQSTPGVRDVVSHLNVREPQTAQSQQPAQPQQQASAAQQ